MNKKVLKQKSSNLQIKIPKFKSIYAKLLFFNLKSHVNEHEYLVSLDNLKSILLTPSLSYTYSHLKIKVLDIIKDEFLSIESPILFTYEIIQENKTCFIKFIICLKNK